MCNLLLEVTNRVSSCFLIILNYTGVDPNRIFRTTLIWNPIWPKISKNMKIYIGEVFGFNLVAIS